MAILQPAPFRGIGGGCRRPDREQRGPGPPGVAVRGGAVPLTLYPFWCTFAAACPHAFGCSTAAGVAYDGEDPGWG